MACIGLAILSGGIYAVYYALQTSTFDHSKLLREPIKTPPAMPTGEFFPSATSEPGASSTTIVENTLAPSSTVVSTALIQTPIPSLSPTSITQSSWKQGKLAFPLREDYVNHLYELDLTQNDLAPRLLFSDVGSLMLDSPMWSPDGKTIAFNYRRTGLYLLSPGESDIPLFINQCAAATWSPDGRKLICGSYLQAAFNVYDVKNGLLDSRIRVEETALFPNWSPIEDILFYVNAEFGQHSSIWRRSLSGEGDPILLAGEANENYAPALSPDGKWIAFQSDLNNSTSDIWVMDTDGGNQRRVLQTPAGYWSRAPSWSPDGQWLAFVSNQNSSFGSGHGEIFIVPVLGGTPIQVTQTGGRVYEWRVTWGK
jgi:Tol biopolymer transport system component